MVLAKGAGTSKIKDNIPGIGTVSRDFFTQVFSIKQLILVPLDRPRSDFEFFGIFEELFIFVIDSTGASDEYTVVLTKIDLQ
jgi:hypothetical protein